MQSTFTGEDDFHENQEISEDIKDKLTEFDLQELMSNIDEFMENAEAHLDSEVLFHSSSLHVNSLVQNQKVPHPGIIFVGSERSKRKTFMGNLSTLIFGKETFEKLSILKGSQRKSKDKGTRTQIKSQTPSPVLKSNRKSKTLDPLRNPMSPPSEGGFNPDQKQEENQQTPPQRKSNPKLCLPADQFFFGTSSKSVNTPGSKAQEKIQRGVVKKLRAVKRLQEK